MTPCIVLVPVRDFRTGKSRLSPVLSEEERDGLGRWMLERVLAALRGAAAACEVAVLSDAEEVLSLAAELGAAGLLCEGRDMNADLERGRGWALARGAASLAVIPGDLPLLGRDDVDAFLEKGAPGHVLLSPSPDGGTNALWTPAADAIPFRFGPGSFEKHRAAAEAAGLKVRIHEGAGFRLDVDQPGDLDAFLEAGAPAPPWLEARPKR
ncbi:MAG: 2-phospho-L-lactate guanylyltransferase [bacterium]|nr:2-phospho-L-lactate guanylyltransferase [bacterium]